MAQAPTATFIRLPPLKAMKTAAIKPADADITLLVALSMAGNVITERVTYGT